MALIEGAREGRAQGGGTISTRLLGTIATIRKRRQEEDKVRRQAEEERDLTRQAEEEELERELKKIKETEIQKRVTGFRGEREETKGKLLLERIKGIEARKTEEVKGKFKDKVSPSDEAFGSIGGDRSRGKKDERIEGFRKQLQKGEILVRRGNDVFAIKESEIRDGDVRI